MQRGIANTQRKTTKRISKDYVLRRDWKARSDRATNRNTKENTRCKEKQENRQAKKRGWWYVAWLAHYRMTNDALSTPTIERDEKATI